MTLIIKLWQAEYTEQPPRLLNASFLMSHHKTLAWGWLYTFRFYDLHTHQRKYSVCRVLRINQWPHKSCSFSDLTYAHTRDNTGLCVAQAGMFTLLFGVYDDVKHKSLFNRWPLPQVISIPPSQQHPPPLLFFLSFPLMCEGQSRDTWCSLWSRYKKWDEIFSVVYAGKYRTFSNEAQSPS